MTTIYPIRHKSAARQSVRSLAREKRGHIERILMRHPWLVMSLGMLGVPLAVLAGLTLVAGGAAAVCSLCGWI